MDALWKLTSSRAARLSLFVFTMMVVLSTWMALLRTASAQPTPTATPTPPEQKWPAPDDRFVYIVIIVLMASLLFFF
jgi:hypothetical protein